MMKRQRLGHDGSRVAPTSISIDDVFEFLEDNDTVTNEQLVALEAQITKLRSKKISALLQRFPTELWALIFPLVGRLNQHETGEDLKFWLSCRTVSKLWQSCISTLDLSFCMEDDAWLVFRLPRILSLLHFSAVTLPPAKKSFDAFCLLQNTRSLTLCCNSIHPDKMDQLTQLTQLTELTCEHETLPQHALLPLTNLQKLNLTYVLGISSLEPLINLKQLKLKHMSAITDISSLTGLQSLTITSHKIAITQDQTHAMKNLTHLECSDISFFRSGRGCHDNHKMDQYYKGEFLDGKRHGQGNLHFGHNGTDYDGEWFQNQQHGKGAERRWTEDGYVDVYRGDWFYGKRKGKGTRTYRNTDVYEGDWVDGQREGHGIYRWKNGTVYEGGFLSNQPDGTGRCVYPNGDAYDGLWKHGSRQGTGKYTVAGGEEDTWSAELIGFRDAVFCVDSAFESDSDDCEASESDFVISGI